MGRGWIILLLSLGCIFAFLASVMTNDKDG